jgi:hypothetical protein
MSSEKYIGLDVHQATISVAVMDSKGKVVMECILETKAATILEFFAGLRGTLAVTFEKGTWAAWLHDLLKPHVAKLVRSTGRRGSSRDAASRVEDHHATGWHHFSRQDYPQLYCAARLVMKRQALCLSGRMPDFRSPYLYLWWLGPHPQACTCAR